MATPNNSRAYAYVLQKGWAHRLTEDHIILEYCPVCSKGGWKFYMRFSPSEKDGLWDDKHCSESGNLYQLMEFNGDRMSNVTSIGDVANAGRKPDAMPNIEAAHQRLLDEAEDGTMELPALEYLVKRGYTMKVIEQYKLGLVKEYGKRWLLIPYFHKNSPIFAKFRTLPPDPKEFRGLSGREAPLFNQDCLTSGMEELVFVEGEGDALSLLSNGIEYVVGVPGANLKKMAWIAKLDELDPKVIYLLYDRDKTGQNAAKEMAGRIGLEKVRNILLPEFTFTDENGEEKPGKDINEWFRAGHTAEEFEQLKAEAKFFSVDCVYSAAEVIDEVRQDVLQGRLKPRWYSKWDSLNRRLGGFEPGDLVGIMAEAKIGKSSLALDNLDFMVKEFGEPGLNFCQEMMPKRVVKKWMSNVTDTPEHLFTMDTVDTALRIAAERPADLLFAYAKGKKRQEIYDIIRQAVRRYGVKFVVFDNLQLLVRSLENSSQETSTITKEFKDLAMELGIVIFLIIQPHRVRDGEIVSARNAMGSSAIEKDVDIMICLHRERVGRVSGEEFAAIGFLEVDENFAPEMLVRVDLSRYAAGGTTTLKFLGDRSRVEEMSYQDKVEKSSLVPTNMQLDLLEAA